MAHLIHFIVGFALLLHVVLWGAGAAMLVMPWPWRRFWPVLIIPFGLALQSAVVWAGAHTGLRGTNSYAWASEVVPLGLLALGLWRRGWRASAVDVSRFGLVWLLVAGCLAALILPLAIASKGLTTLSLGGCDAGDYAGGARVLMEFARSDGEGFLGLTEVVRTQSVDNFFDYWIWLNHFTPSALIALNGSVLHCAPHELTSLLTMVLLAGSLPVVFWVARAVLGYSGGVSVVLAGLYGFSPITWYIVVHVAPGQLLAAQAIALLTWIGVALWRGRLTWGRARQFSGVLAGGYWLVLGSYNFFVLVCLLPAVAFAGGLALWTGDWPRLRRWTAMMLLPLVACGAIFFERVAGLPERFTLLRGYDFGWRIPSLSPEGWLGMVSGPELAAWEFGGLRWLLTLVVIVAFAWGMARAVHQGRRGAWVAICLAAPALAGYAFLEGRGAQLETNASYDAYKLFAVFYPELLPAMFWWVTLRRSGKISEWFGVVALGLVVIGFNLVAVGMFAFHMARPPLIVDGELRQLRKIEAMADVKSINILLPDMWSRLWANAFLLRKPQYFLTDTYEGRWHTPLRGEWNLEDSILKVKPAGDGLRQITTRYALVAARGPHSMTAALGDGWNNEEHALKTSERWQWSRNTATLRLENPHEHPLTVSCTIDGWSFGERDVVLEINDARSNTPLGSSEPQHLGALRKRTVFTPLTVPPGVSNLVLSVPPALISAGSGDQRELGVCVFGFEIEVKE